MFFTKLGQEAGSPEEKISVCISYFLDFGHSYYPLKHFETWPPTPGGLQAPLFTETSPSKAGGPTPGLAKED